MADAGRAGAEHSKALSRSPRMWWQRLAHTGVVFAVLARPLIAAPPPDAILIDAGSGASLREQGADTQHAAAPLSPLMVALVSLEYTALGLLPPGATVSLSAAGAAAVAGGVRIPLRDGKAYPVNEVIEAMLLTGADDAAVALGEMVGGTLEGCVNLMNARALRLGLTDTRYVGVGRVVPSQASPGDTTARDVARLARALIAHQSVLEWTSLSGFPFDGGAVLLRNPNHLLGTVAGVDGLYVSANATSGTPMGDASNGKRKVAARRRAQTATRGAEKATHAIVATAQRDGLRLIAVVLGATDSAACFATAADWLSWGFREYERVTVLRKGDRLKVGVHVRDGAASEVLPAARETVSFLRRRGEEREIVMRYQLPNEVAAPVARDQRLGELLVEEEGRLIAVVPLVSSTRVPSSRMMSGDLP
jgi:D-alanyl-D-alanine carboxypeptidase (penicillin-binding protein 5/6)